MSETFRDYEHLNELVARAFITVLSAVEPDCNGAFHKDYAKRAEHGDPGLTFEFKVNGHELPFSVVIQAINDHYVENVRATARELLREKHQELVESLDKLKYQIEEVTEKIGG